MSGFAKSVIVLETITPVHVGTGEEFDPLRLYFYKEIQKGNAGKDLAIDYCADLNTEAIIKHLSIEKQDIVSKFSSWINSSYDSMINSIGSLELSKLRGELSFAGFLKRYYPDLNDDKIKTLITEGEFFTKKLKINIKNLNNHRFKRHISMNGQAYIPGTEIKGVIRTALAINIIKNLPNEEVERIFNQALGDFRDNEGHRAVPTAESRIMNRLFNCSNNTNKMPYYDLMKFISISDAITKQPVTSLYQLSTVSLQRNRNRNNSFAVKNQEIDIHELIEKDIKMVFLLEVKLDELLRIRRANNKEGWIHLDEKFRLAFGYNLSDILARPRQEAQRLLAQKILEAIKAHGNAVLGEDIKWAEKFGFVDPSLQKIYNPLIKEKEKIANNPQMSFAKIGFGTGFLTKTIMIEALNSPRGKELYRNIFAQKKLHVSISKRKGLTMRPGDINPETLINFPSSRILISNLKEGGYRPLGWVKLEIEDK